MPSIDREAAKAAGYSDQEIDAFSQGAGLDSVSSAPQEIQGGGVNPAALGIGAVGVGAGLYGASKIPAAMRSAPKLARAAGRMIPGVRDVMHMGDALQELRGGQAASAGTAPTISASTTTSEAPQGMTTVSQHFRTLPKPKPAPKPKAGSAASRVEPKRPISIVKGGKSTRAYAPSNEPPNGPGVGKGASGPQLARRAAAREAVRETGAVPRPPAGSVASRTAPQEAMSDLEAQLMRSLEAAQAARTVGAAPRQMFSALRGAGGPAVQLLMMLLGAQNTEQDMQAANDMLTPEHIRRAEEQAMMGHAGPQ